jgi:hypothetical protein
VKDTSTGTSTGPAHVKTLMLYWIRQIISMMQPEHIAAGNLHMMLLSKFCVH